MKFDFGTEEFGDKNPTDQICVVLPNEMVMAVGVSFRIGQRQFRAF